MTEYIFINNATGQPNSSIGTTDTSIEIGSTSSNMTSALIQVVNGESHALLTLTDNAESKHEVVEVTAESYDAGTGVFTLTVTRGQDDTSAQAWTTSDQAEIRAPAKLLNNLLTGVGSDSIRIGSGDATGADAINIGTGSATSSKGISIGFSADAEAADSVVIGSNAYTDSADTVAVGNSASAYGTGGVSIGDSAYSEQNYPVAIGGSASAYGEKSVALGYGSFVNAADAVAIGDVADAESTESIAIGKYSYSEGNYSIAVGSNAMTDQVKAVAVGYEAYGFGVNGVAVGPGAESNGDFCTAIGSDAAVPSGIGPAAYAKMLFAQPAATDLASYTPLTTNDLAARHRAAPLITLATEILDLTDATDEDEFALPSGAHFYPDRVDVIIVSASSPTGSPEIVVGTLGETIVDSFTLYLGGATGGTYDLGQSGSMQTLNYDDSAATIESALETVYGAGEVTVAADTDFTITFSAATGDSELIADFTNLTGATDPALTQDTEYQAADTNSILAASIVTVDTANQRQQFTPDSLHGVQQIYAGVSTAGGGTLTGRLIISGYLVTDE